MGEMGVPIWIRPRRWRRAGTHGSGTGILDWSTIGGTGERECRIPIHIQTDKARSQRRAPDEMDEAVVGRRGLELCSRHATEARPTDHSLQAVG